MVKTCFFSFSNINYYYQFFARKNHGVLAEYRKNAKPVRLVLFFGVKHYMILFSFHWPFKFDLEFLCDS